MNISDLDKSGFVTSEREIYLPARFTLIIQLMSFGEFSAIGSAVPVDVSPVIKAQIERACLYVGARCMRAQLDQHDIRGLEQHFPGGGHFNIERQVYREVLQAQASVVAAVRASGTC